MQFICIIIQIQGLCAVGGGTLFVNLDINIAR